MINDEIFSNIDGIPLTHELNTNYTKNPYGFLKPYFVQMMDMLENNCSMEELIEVKNKFMDITDAKRKMLYDNMASNLPKTKAVNDIPFTSSTHVYASSNVSCEKKRTTHGTKHY